MNRAGHLVVVRIQKRPLRRRIRRDQFAAAFREAELFDHDTRQAQLDLALRFGRRDHLMGLGGIGNHKVAAGQQTRHRRFHRAFKHLCRRDGDRGSVAGIEPGHVDQFASRPFDDCMVQRAHEQARPPLDLPAKHGAPAALCDLAVDIAMTAVTRSLALGGAAIKGPAAKCASAAGRST